MSGLIHTDSALCRIVPVLLTLALCGCDGVQSILNPGSPDAAMVARLGWWMFGCAAFILFVTLGLVLTAVSLRHGREARPLSRLAATALVVAGGVIAPIIAIIALSISGVFIGDETEGDGPGATLTVEVVAEQWWWAFRYLDDDGNLIAETANELHLPVGERARLRLISDNVIHSFWAPNLQGKTDVIPGRQNVMYAEPDVSGTWRGQCAEFCGLQHALMGFNVVAEPRVEFDWWLAGQAADARVTSGAGLEAFMDLGCGKCHSLRGTPAQGTKGPDLTHLASRDTIAAATLPNSRGNLGGWITDTHSVKPGALMPPTVPEPRQLQALLDFLEALE